MIFVILQIVTVIERDFLAGFDVTNRHDPDHVAKKFRFAIRRATVVDVFGRIPIDIAIEIKLIIERENVMILILAAFQRFRLGNFFADIFDDRRFLFDFLQRETAGSIDSRFSEFN